MPKTRDYQTEFLPLEKTLEITVVGDCKLTLLYCMTQTRSLTKLHHVFVRIATNLLRLCTSGVVVIIIRYNRIIENVAGISSIIVRTTD